MSHAYPVWTGAEWIELPVPVSGGEPVVVPNVNAVVYNGPDRRSILLQHRDKPGEVVRGRLELPGGRWRAGESPDTAIAREVEEETGVRLTAVAAAVEHIEHEPQIGTATARPLAVVVGTEGAYPSLHVILECYGEGQPHGVPGETAHPAWWRVEDVVALLEREPEAFVWQAVAALRAALT